jgi:hypothetical protein
MDLTMADKELKLEGRDALESARDRIRSSSDPVVFVPQVTMRRGLCGKLEPRFDLSPAEQYGRLQIMLPQDFNPLFGTKKIVSALRQKLADYRAGDSLLLIGNPIIIGLATAIAAETCREIIFLQWSGTHSEYLAVPASLQ